MARQRVLVLGCTAPVPWTRDQLVRLSRQAHRRGLVLVGADSAANLRAAGRDELSVVDEIVELDVRSPDACRAWAAAAARDFHAVLTLQELCVLSAAVVAEELGLPGNDPNVVRAIRTKDVCRERLRAAGFAQPRTAVCTSRADAVEFIRGHAGPWIVKPRDGLGSSGVSLVRDATELPAAMARLADLSAIVGRFGARNPARGGPEPFLIETFVPGEEFSAEGVMVGGAPVVLALTAKRTGSGFVETGHRVAPVVDGALAAATDTVIRAITATGVTHGAFHVEFWRSAGEVVLGEVHARPGGDYIHALVEHGRPGLEFYGLLLDDLLGWPAAPVPAHTRAAGVDFLLLPPGRLRAVHGWPEIVRHPRVLAADLLVEAGTEIRAATDSLNRHGVIVAGSDDPHEVDEVLATLGSRLVADVDPVAGLTA